MEAAAKHARLLRNTGDLEQDLPAVTEIPCHWTELSDSRNFKTTYFSVKRQISKIHSFNFFHESFDFREIVKVIQASV